jgi:hypothetical protein
MKADCKLRPEEALAHVLGGPTKPTKARCAGLKAGRGDSTLQDSKDKGLTVKAPPHSAAIVPILLYSAVDT